MSNRINLVLHGFLVGMLFEYILRVETSIYPILLMIIIILGLIIDIVLYYMGVKRDRLLAKIEEEVLAAEHKLKTVPEGWYVSKAGQNETTKLWFIELLYYGNENENKSVDGDTRIFVEDGESNEEVLILAIKLAD